MEDEKKDTQTPVDVFTADTPTPDEQAEYERVKDLHIRYAAELHALNAKYLAEAHFQFCHRTMALVFAWSDGDESNTAPVNGYVVSHPNEFLVNSSPGKIFRVCQSVLQRMQQSQAQAEEIQQALGNSFPPSSGIIH